MDKIMFHKIHFKLKCLKQLHHPEKGTEGTHSWTAPWCFWCEGRVLWEVAALSLSQETEKREALDAPRPDSAPHHPSGYSRILPMGGGSVLNQLCLHWEKLPAKHDSPCHNNPGEPRCREQARSWEHTALIHGATLPQPQCKLEQPGNCSNVYQLTLFPQSSHKGSKTGQNSMQEIMVPWNSIFSPWATNIRHSAVT